MAKQRYGNKGPKRNPIAAHIQQTQNIEKKLQEATMDGVRYGLIAMEVFDHAYRICISTDGIMTESQSGRYTKLNTEFTKKITTSYVPMAEIPQLIFDLFNPDLNETSKIPSVDWLKDVIVNNNPKLGAYF